MAQIRFSNLVNDIRGAAGGITFSRSTSGAMVSAKRSKRSRKRKKGGTSVTSISAVAGVWRTLTQAEQYGWNEAAKQYPVRSRLGSFYISSGFQMFCAANFYRIQAGYSIIKAYTPLADAPSFRLSDVQWRVSDNRILANVSGNPSYTGTTLLYTSPAAPPSRKVYTSAALSFIRSSPSQVLTISAYVASQMAIQNPNYSMLVGGRFKFRYVVVFPNHNWPVRIVDAIATIVP